MTLTLIYTLPSRLVYKNIRNVCIVVLLSLSASVRMPNAKGYFEGRFGNEVGLVIFLVMCILVSLIIVMHLLMRYKKKVGQLVLTPEKMSIQINDNSQDFLIGDITNFSVMLNKYLSRKIPTLARSYENWVSFAANNKTYRYQFIFDSFYSENKVKELIDLWLSQNAIQVTIIDNETTANEPASSRRG